MKKQDSLSRLPLRYDNRVMKLLDIIPDLDKICSEHINPLKFIKRRFIDQCFRADIAMVGHIGNNRFQILLLQRSEVIIRKELRQFFQSHPPIYANLRADKSSHILAKCHLAVLQIVHIFFLSTQFRPQNPFQFLYILLILKN